MSTGIIVDTSVWVEFFRAPSSPLTRHLLGLLRSNRVVLVGMVLAELLQGIRNSKEAARVRRSLEALPYTETTRSAWQMAGEVSAALRRKGVTVPLSDLVIAAVALGEDCELFTVDPHFELVPQLKLHSHV